MVRGFSVNEFRQRLTAAQALMAKADLSALLLTAEPEVRYYTGFLTRFWESPSRPWFVVLPARGDPIAVIPGIGVHLMARTWVKDIRTWQAPDYDDDGIGLLASTLAEVTPADGRIGIAQHMESHLRMPLADYASLKARLGSRQIVEDDATTRRLRMVKSDAEIAKIEAAARIADAAFDAVSTFAVPGTPLSRVFRDFQMACLQVGADWVPYVAGAAGQGGYGDVISPATEAPLVAGDVLMLDTGLVWDGYFCDFDRNFSLGPPSSAVQRAHETLIAATEKGFAAARPGSTMSDLFDAMNRVVNPGGNPMDAGRMGHGLGMQLTEWPSVIPQDHTILEPGMVLTLEPAIDVGDGRLLVHEENIVIEADGARYLSTPQAPHIRVIA